MRDGAEPETAGLSDEDREILEDLDRALADALDLKRWWEEADAADAYDERFKLSATHGRSNGSFGFFGRAEVGGSPTSVMGDVQEQLYDHPKTPGESAAARKKAAEWMSAQMREFVLHYLPRIIDFRQPEAFSGDREEKPPAYLLPVSWYSQEDGAGTGFGFEQIYYKLKGEDEPRKFSPEDRYRIVDLRQIGSRYEWVVVKVDVFDLKLVLAPLGQSYPYGTVPGTEPSYLILSEALVLDQEPPEGSDDLGRYGFGYAFLPAAEESLLAYGPGRFEAAVQLIHFHVKKSGEVVSRMTFVANRPEKVVNVSLDPVSWGLRMADVFSFGTASQVIEPMQKMWSRVPRLGGVDVVQSYITLANALTGGGAARSLGVSKKQLHKNFLVAHFAQHYNVVAGSLVAWRQVPDWLDRENLPDWALTGKTA